MKKDHEHIKLIKEDYEEIRKKFSLPNFEDLDNEFEIRKIDEDGFILREVKRAIIARLQNLAHFFLPVLNPQPHDVHSLVEMGIFNKKEKEKLFKFYKKILYLIHKGVMMNLKTDKDTANFIKDVWKDWPALKAECEKYMKEVTQEWLKEKKKETNQSQGYLG